MSDLNAPTVPSHIDFATEVKADRLVVLWRVTFGVAAVVMFFAFSIVSVMGGVSWVLLLAAPVVLMTGSYITNLLLRRQRYQNAARVYTMTLMMAVTVALLDSQPLTLNIVPFGYAVVMFVAGLLLRPGSIIKLAFAATAATLLLPFLLTGSMAYLTGYQGAAVALIAISAALAYQSTGELYAVTEWALMNYERERRMNLDLHENRAELQRALRRSQALSDELKTANRELESARAAAETAKEFRGKFLANMSHELRTPLNAISGFSQTMLNFPEMYEGVLLPELYQRDLRQINASGEQLLNVINDILDLARVDAGRLEIVMQPVNARPIVENVQGVAAGLVASKPIKLTTDLPDDLPDVHADETRLRQVLLNLYSNATKFTEAGSIHLAARETAEGVQFSLTDTGSGISPEHLERIFEEFRQAGRGRDPRSGSGLGLAIARQLLGLMGGRIWAESVPGEGSTFHILLRRANGVRGHQVITNADQINRPQTTEQSVVKLPAVEAAPKSS